MLSIVDPKLTDAEQTLLASARKKMDAVRAKRAPHLDDKILSSWNGLMLGAVARASAVLNEKNTFRPPRPTTPSPKNIFGMPNPNHVPSLARRRTRQCATTRCLRLPIDGTLHLYEATLQAKYLEQAVALADRMIALFYDQENGGFWQGTGKTGFIMRVRKTTMVPCLRLIP